MDSSPIQDMSSTATSSIPGLLSSALPSLGSSLLGSMPPTLPPFQNTSTTASPALLSSLASLGASIPGSMSPSLPLNATSPPSLSSTFSSSPLFSSTFSSSPLFSSSFSSPPLLPSTVPPPVPVASLAASLNIPYVTAELFIAALSTAGNLLVCVAVATERRLRTVTNYFLVSLAVADVCVGALAIPCAILTDMGIPRNTHADTRSQTQQTRALTHPQLYLCLFMLSVLIMLTQSSILSLLAVAVERYVAIFLPFRHQRYMTGRLAVLVIVCVWVLAFLMGLVPLMGWYREGAGESGRCSFVQVVDMRYMVFFNFFVCVLAPLVVMLLLYAHIFSLAQRQSRRINQETQLGRRINVERQVNAATDGEGQGDRHDAQAMQLKQLKQEVKTATSVFMVLFLFAICWLPLHIINCFLLLSPASPVPLPLLLTAIILSHANSALNPLLYAYKMRPFRHAFKRLLCCK